jgi:uncharacterized membrane protein
MIDDRLVPPDVAARRATDETRIGRALIAVTYVSVAILALGVLAMIVLGISPLDPAPVIGSLTALLDAVRGLQPQGIIWIGLAVVIATPILRVILAAIAFARGAEWRMVAISVAILIVIAIGVATALATEV